MYKGYMRDICRRVEISEIIRFRIRVRDTGNYLRPRQTLAWAAGHIGLQRSL